MPTYDYQCRSCGSVTEVIHSMLEAGPTACERCGGELRRVLYPTGIIFKGSGFYRTDSRSSGTVAADSKTAATDTKGTGSEAKSESKSEPKPSGGEGKKASEDSGA